MLLSRRRQLASTTQDVSTVHNYYERLVTEAIVNVDPRARTDADYMDDISCVALNHLPPRYIRHDVDMSFYLSPIELDEINNKVDKAVKHAIEFVNSREEAQRSDDEQESNTEH